MIKKEGVNTPDFLKIPYQLFLDKTLKPADLFVYSVILLYSHGDKGCIASNETIAEMADIRPSSVPRSLKRLEDKGYTRSMFRDASKRKRIEIAPLMGVSEKQKNRKNGFVSQDIHAYISQGIHTYTPQDIQYTPQDIHDNPTGYTRIPSRIDVKSQDEKSENVENKGVLDEKDPKTYIQPDHRSYIDKRIDKLILSASRLDTTDSSNGITNINGDDIYSAGFDNEENVLSRIEPELTPLDLANMEIEKELGRQVNKILDVFYLVFPGDFVGKATPFTKLPVRAAVKAAIKTYGVEKLEDMIKKYDEGKTDQYRPAVGTVLEFCTYKLAKVEAYISKNRSSGLYSQKPISSEAHGKRIDGIIQKQIEDRREKMKKLKEEYNKNNNAN